MMTVEEKISYTLEESFSSLQLVRDNFCLIGSAALFLSGIKIDEIYDIDILVSNRDADFLAVEWRNRLMTAHVTTNDELFSSNFARYKFSVLDIEIMSDLKVNKKGIWQQLEITDKMSVPIGNFKIIIPTLEHQRSILQFFGREKDHQRIKLIDKHLLR